MDLSPEQIRSLAVIFLTSCGAVAAVFLTATLSILLIFALKSIVRTLLDLIALLVEVVIAVIAAITSGATVALTILLATSAAALSFPASNIHSRICTSMVISSGSMFASSLALTWFSSFRLDMEIAAAVVSAAAMSVALASAWAIGVLSLIEKETQQVGLKLTSILDAVRNNNHRILSILVKLHFGLKENDLNIALIHAVKSGYIESINVLLKAGANPNTKDSYENPPLTIACDTGMFDIAAVLIKYGANVNVLNGSKATAMHSAAKWGFEDCVELLLSHSATVNDQDNLWRTPLMLAVKHAKRPEDVMQILITAGAEVNLIGCEKRTALHYAASRGVGVLFLLESGAIPHLKTCDGNTPMHYAAIEGHANIIQIFLDYGCDPNSLNNQDKTPLHMAAIAKDSSCIDILLLEHAKPSMVDRMGNLPIYYAAYHGHIKAVLSLLTVNSPLSSFTYKNKVFYPNCPLQAALENRHFKIAKLLLMSGSKHKIYFDWVIEQPLEIHDRYTLDLCMLREFINKPVTLLHRSRLEIRKMIGLSVHKNIDKIQLPKLLKEYIMMKDLVYLRTEADRLNTPVASLIKTL